MMRRRFLFLLILSVYFVLLSSPTYGALESLVAGSHINSSKYFINDCFEYDPREKYVNNFYNFEFHENEGRLDTHFGTYMSSYSWRNTFASIFACDGNGEWAEISVPGAPYTEFPYPPNFTDEGKEAWLNLPYEHVSCYSIEDIIQDYGHLCEEKLSITNPDGNNPPEWNVSENHIISWVVPDEEDMFFDGFIVQILKDGFVFPPEECMQRLDPLGHYCNWQPSPFFVGTCDPDSSYEVRVIDPRVAGRVDTNRLNLDCSKDICEVEITSITGFDIEYSLETGGEMLITAEATGSGTIIWDWKIFSWSLGYYEKTGRNFGNNIEIHWNGRDDNGKILPAIKLGRSIGFELVAWIDKNGNGVFDEGIDCRTNNRYQAIKNLRTSKNCRRLIYVGSSVDAASGNLSHAQQLFSAGDTSLSLFYNSLDSYQGPLGIGWSHSYDIFIEEYDNYDVAIKFGNSDYRLFKSDGVDFVSQPGDDSTLIKNSDGSFTLIKKEGTKYNFDSEGRFVSIVDRNGNTQAFTYTDGNLTSISDSNGLTTTLAYDTDNHLEKITDPSGKIYQFNIESRLLKSVTYPDGGQWLYNYYANGFMLTKADPGGNTTSYFYDEKHRLESSIDAEGRARSIVYPEFGETVRTSVFTDKDGSETYFTYEVSTGNLLEKIDTLGGVTAYTYGENNYLLTKTDPAGRTTTYTYDENGNRTSVTDPLGQTTTYTYNEYGQVTSTTDPDGGTTTYEYDEAGNLIKLINSSGATSQYQYDASGRIIAITNANGQTMTMSYDSNGNMASVTDFTGAVTTFEYDASGNMISQTDSYGNTTTFEYDSSGNMVGLTDPQGNVTTYTYDANGNRTSQTDANGNTTFFEYNSQGQVIQVEDPLGNITNYNYGGSGGCSSCSGGIDKLKEVIDPNGNITSYAYDSLGRLTSETDPLGNATSYSHDSVGNMISRTDAMGNNISYGYDVLGRLLTKTYPDGAGETYTYDSSGNMLTAANQHISYTMAYDASGRLISVTDSNGKYITYEYDSLGNKISMTAEGKTVIYDHDASNRLAGINSWAGIFNFGYDDLGRRTSLTFPNGVITTYSYDDSGRLTDLITANSKGDILSGYNYTHDNVGNRLSKLETGKKKSKRFDYSYDSIYRLLESVPVVSR